MLQNYKVIPVRASAVLTTSYVAGTVIGKPGYATWDENNISNLHEFDQIVILARFTKASSTSFELKIETASELYYTLLYDGQTANFTVGETITGGTSGATAVVIADTDAGATGTLVIKWEHLGLNKNGFIDNETITGSSTGIAVVNGSVNPKTAAPDDYSFHQKSSVAYSGGTGTLSPIEITRVSASQTEATKGYEIPFQIKAQYARISAKCTGTATSTALKLDVVVGTVS